MAATLRDNGTRQDTWVLRLHINGQDFGIWDKKTGGELDSESTVYYPGNMRGQQDLGGRKASGNITLQRLYDIYDDHDKIATLLNGAGRASAKVTQRPLDENGNEHGGFITWAGRLKRVTTPDVDSESSSAALYEVEISVKGYPTVSGA